MLAPLCNLVQPLCRSLLPLETSVEITHLMQASWLLWRCQLGEPRGEIFLWALKQIERVTQGCPQSHPHPSCCEACCIDVV